MDAAKEHDPSVGEDADTSQASLGEEGAPDITCLPNGCAA